jgi:cytochrome c
MKIITIFTLVGLSLTATSRANSTLSDADAAQFMAKYNCQACHTVDKQLVGPAFRDIAKKYRGDVGAATKLQAKVKNGSTGVWGSIAMPPNNVPAADLQVFIEWLMSLK